MREDGSKRSAGRNHIRAIDGLFLHLSLEAWSHLQLGVLASARTTSPSAQLRNLSCSASLCDDRVHRVYTECASCDWRVKNSYKSPQGGCRLRFIRESWSVHF